MSILDGKTTGRLVLEAVAIVVSILLAFALDAMWDERQLRAWEITQLEVLREEMQQNLDALDPVVATHKLNAQRLSTLVTKLDGAEVGQEITVRDDALISLILWRTSDISSGSLDALLASGKLGDIQNAEIRKRIATWPSRVLDAQEDEILARDFVVHILTPRFAGHGILPMADRGRPMPGNPGSLPVVDSETTFVVTAEMRDLSSARRMHSMLAAYSLSALQDYIREVLVLLDAELEVVKD